MYMYLQINLIAPPLYVVTTQTLERNEGLEKLRLAMDRIKESIETSGGLYTVKMEVSYTIFNTLLAVLKVYCSEH